MLPFSMGGMSLHSIWEVFQNQVLICALTAWFVAQVLKIPTYWLVEKKLDFRRICGSGGMPSSHTAFVVSLAIMIGFVHGFSTVAFAIAFTLAAIVMYDATGVRRETGTQAQVINEILRNVFVNGKPISDDDLKELIGHTPLEVLGGVIVAIITCVFYLCF